MEKFKDIIEKIEKLSVIELSELVKVLEEKFGVSASQMVSAGVGASTEAGAGEEKIVWNVLLKSGGVQKINVIKIIKEVTGLGLKESKDIVEGAPKVVKEGLKKEDAEEIKKKLEAVGAVVELQ
ncbi:MAG: 50S ribosomal protein L7/L12 [Patescibacteria group bacterium]|nr:50S ribosomal protein L7/L12 [Patescibacteria group bacterium]